MPKNKGRNAFFFFMVDWRKRAEAEGHKFPNGLKDVQQDPNCNEEWRSLTKQEKGPYEARAKQDKISSQISSKEKKTSYGESLRLLELKEKEAEMFIKNMQENIKLMIDSAVNLNFLPQLKFCFVHVNHFFTKIVNNTAEYFPAEYAFGIFSLENGIEDVYHVIVSAEIPLGYRREALEQSQESHNIPVEYPGGETDFAVMYEKLEKFLESRKLVDQYPYLYTTRHFKNKVQSLIAKLCDAAEQDKNQFIIYEMESLFEHLANECYKKRPDRLLKHIPIYAENVFTQLTYIFEKGFECHLHKYIDGGTETCSKSVLHQWAWILCEEFCKPLEIDMKPGIHCPYKLQEQDFSSVTNMMNNIKVEDAPRKSKPEVNALLSMTGVSEQHRLKVSSRSHEEEMRRRKESKPITVIDYSELQESASKPVEAIKSSLDKSAKTSVEEKTKYVSKYLNEKPLRPPNIDSHAYIVSTTTSDFLPTDDENFPPIGGRGVSLRSQRTNTTRKPPLGKGQGHK
ncbi:protein maelstrom 2 [Monomorium pharaonis]|uniref:protein maelstrom 2 n=1 Tax=Monomorium pharaonis TaxID=307658 RepID=UPI00063ED3C2|nr:protein maelstrom 2 [Monomorium pharaonis]